MPYIKQELRPKMDKIVDRLAKIDLFENEMNFILFEFCKNNILQSYNNYKNFCGELRQCVNEIKRRFKIEFTEELPKFDFEIPESRKKILKNVVELMKNLNIQVNGDLNYVLYAFCKKHVKARFYRCYDPYYQELYCNELIHCIEKIEKELLGPYENKKILENGDI